MPKPNAKKNTRVRDIQADHLKRWSEYLGVSEEQLRTAIRVLIN